MEKSYAEMIKEYLWLGYVQPNEIPKWIYEGIVKQENIYDSREFNLRIESLFDGICSSANGLHIVPMSGGWDSRIILAELLQRYNTNEIKTVTFGIPGQLDYDIAKYIAKKTGVVCEVQNLNELDFTWARLLESAKVSPWTYVPDGFVNQTLFNRYDSGNIWSGFLGDPLAGSHYKRDVSPNLYDEYECFLNTQKRGEGFVDENFRPSMPPGINEHEVLRGNEVFDFFIRQYSCIAPIIFPKEGWQSWSSILKITNQKSFITPFTDLNWANYLLNAPRDLHINQNFYLNSARKRHPFIMELKSKQYWGHKKEDIFRTQISRLASYSVNQVSKLTKLDNIKSVKMCNYLDFNLAFRKRKDFKELLDITSTVLNDSGYIEQGYFDKIYREHLRYNDKSQDLIVLLGLALNIVANTGERTELIKCGGDNI